MTCEEVGRYLHLYLDGEFASEDRIDFSDHLALCAQCKRRVEGEEAFWTDFRKKLVVRPAPAHLRAQVADDLITADEPRLPSHQTRLETALRWVPIALAAAILAVVAWPTAMDESGAALDTALTAGVPNPSSSASSEPVDVAPARSVAAAPVTILPPQVTYGATHRVSGGGIRPASTGAAYGASTRGLRRLPPDVRGSETKVLGYLAPRLPFRARTPLREDATLRLLGARHTTFEGRPAALFIYERAGERIAVIQHAASSAATRSSSATRRVTRTGSATVGHFLSAGLAHTVVCELDPKTLSALLDSHLLN